MVVVEELVVVVEEVVLVVVVVEGVGGFGGGGAGIHGFVGVICQDNESEGNKRDQQHPPARPAPPLLSPTVGQVWLVLEIRDGGGWGKDLETLLMWQP